MKLYARQYVQQSNPTEVIIGFRSDNQSLSEPEQGED